MSTEYRRGIPSTAHVEAATRLGLEWGEARTRRNPRRWRFQIRGGELWCDFFSDNLGWDSDLSLLSGGRVADRVDVEQYTFHPIRPDGTPVDWEVLDQEVARAGQPQPLAGRDSNGTQFAINTDGSRSPLPAQPQSFRADLWIRLNEWVTANWLNTLGDIRVINDRGVSGHTRRYSWDELGLDTEADEADRQALIARWAVYQELKPLYDIVDGAQGEVAMPRDVIDQWWLPARNADRARQPIERCTLIRSDTSPRYPQGRGPTCSWYADGADVLDIGLRNFTAVLDAVAERRVAERMQGQTQAPTVTLQQYAQLDVETTLAVLRTQSAASAPEPRRFADMRPDRHGWRWWRDITTDDCFTIRDGVYVVRRFGTMDPWSVLDLSAWLDRTVIPTDEQGNPVSWESIGLTVARTAVFDAPQPTALPRFTADELDDVDHSRTTKLDQVTLRRGKLPTIEQIAKYREVRAKRTGGTVADALKESRIDCEVAQYVLERWTYGLGAESTKDLIACVAYTTFCDTKQIDEIYTRWRERKLDTTEPPDTTAQQARQRAEERRQRLAQVQAQIATERATAPQDVSEPSRFDLIEPDPQADPTTSIRAWEARQAAAKREKTKVAAIPAKPVAVPRRPAIEVVHAKEGLNRGDVVWALLGRARHGRC